MPCYAAGLARYSPACSPPRSAAPTSHPCSQAADPTSLTFDCGWVASGDDSANTQHRRISALCCSVRA
eukprot:2749309-Rhodomonas_salina.3